MKKIKIIFTCFLFSLLLLIPTLSLAQTNVTNNPGSTSLENPIPANSFQELIGIVINSVLGLVGSLALLMFVYGGLTWMTSSGSQEKVKKGKDIITWSALGLVIVFGAYGITRFIINITTGS